MHGFLDTEITTVFDYLPLRVLLSRPILRNISFRMQTGRVGRLAETVAMCQKQAIETTDLEARIIKLEGGSQ